MLVVDRSKFLPKKHYSHLITFHDFLIFILDLLLDFDVPLTNLRIEFSSWKVIKHYNHLYLSYGRVDAPVYCDICYWWIIDFPRVENTIQMQIFILTREPIYQMLCSQKNKTLGNHPSKFTRYDFKKVSHRLCLRYAEIILWTYVCLGIHIKGKLTTKCI